VRPVTNKELRGRDVHLRNTQEDFLMQNMAARSDFRAIAVIRSKPARDATDKSRHQKLRCTLRPVEVNLVQRATMASELSAAKILAAANDVIRAILLSFRVETNCREVFRGHERQ